MFAVDVLVHVCGEGLGLSCGWLVLVLFGKVVVGGALWWAVWGASTCMWGSLLSMSMFCTLLLGLSLCWSIGSLGCCAFVCVCVTMSCPVRLRVLCCWSMGPLACC